MAINIGPQGVIDDSAQWIGDPTGLQGPQGDKGNQGNQGNQGKQGAKGNTGGGGAQGYQGKTGNQGNKGDNSTVAGDTGEQGAKGDQGDKGSQGDNAGANPTFTTVTIGTESISSTNVDEFKHAATNHLHSTDGIDGKATFDDWYYVLGNMKVMGGIIATGNVGNYGTKDINFSSDNGVACTNKPVSCHFNTYGNSVSYAVNMTSSQTYKVTITGMFGTGRNIIWTCFCNV